MGVILSKFRSSKPSIRERLEKVDKEIRAISRYQVDTELSQKRCIGRFLIASSTVYIISLVLFYFFGPKGHNWKYNLLYYLPFMIFPLLIWLMKKGMNWHFKRKIGGNLDKYSELKKEKQRLLEDVMEYETFNNAKEILEKYDPNRLLPKYLADQIQRFRKKRMFYENQQSNQVS